MNMNIVRVAVGVAVAAGVGYMGYRVVTTVKKETDKMAKSAREELVSNMYTLKTMAAIFSHEFTDEEEKLIERAEKLLEKEKPDFVEIIAMKTKTAQLVNALVKQYHPEEKPAEEKKDEAKAETKEEAKAA